MRTALDTIDALAAEIASRRPLKPGELTQLRKYYTVGVTFASNAIEGNTLTETETKVVIEEGMTIGGKPLRDHLEAVGHAEALQAMFKMADKKSCQVTEAEVQELHRMFFYKIDPAKAGVYRGTNVIITGSKHSPPHHGEVPGLMKEALRRTAALAGTAHPVDLAGDTHFEIAAIHPFEDGNGRAARLALNLVLVRYGFPPMIFPPPVRTEYLSSLEQGQTAGRRELFRDLVRRMVVEACRERIRLLDALDVE